MYHWIFKLHPSETIFSPYLELVEKNRLRNVEFLRDFDLRELINCADVVITTSSTGGFEALLQRKPLIIITPNNFDNPILGLREFGASIVNNEYDLVRTIISVINNPSYYSEKGDASKDSLDIFSDTESNLEKLLSITISYIDKNKSAAEKIRKE
jgi:CDP-glycerol glycerophosphotransferase (TagB/SpsB family)